MLLRDKVALVVGASGSVGSAIAKRFAYEGANLILVAKSLSGLEKVDDDIKKMGRNSTLAHIDLNNFNMIDSLGSSINSMYGKLDIFVNASALFGELTPLADIEESLFVEIMRVNLISCWKLFKICDPLLKLSTNGRVIVISSGLIKRVNLAFWGPYAISKNALETLVSIYASEVSHTNIKVNMVDPGEIHSNIYKKIFPGIDASKLVSPDEITDIFVKLASEKCKFSGKTHYAQY